MRQAQNWAGLSNPDVLIGSIDLARRRTDSEFERPVLRVRGRCFTTIRLGRVRECAAVRTPALRMSPG